MYCIAVFTSRNESLYLAKLLTTNSIRNAVINTPKDAGLSCGLSVKFEERNLQRVRMIILSKPFRSFSGLYRVTFFNNRNSYEKIS